MKKTANYQLSQWEKSDRLMMEDFNSDNSKMDAALATLQNVKADAAPVNATLSSLQTQINARATTSTVNALQTTVSGKVGIVTGRYTGSGANTQAISLGFQPKAVLVLRSDGHLFNGSQGFAGLAAPGIPGVYKNGTFLEITSSGFTVGKGEEGGNWGTYLNDSAYKYHYIAFR